MTITGNTGLAARAQRDAAQFNLKLKFKNKKKIKPQAASNKQQAASYKPQATSGKQQTLDKTGL